MSDLLRWEIGECSVRVGSVQRRRERFAFLLDGIRSLKVDQELKVFPKIEGMADADRRATVSELRKELTFLVKRDFPALRVRAGMNDTSVRIGHKKSIPMEKS